jgi:hypothetical protein
MPDEDNNIRFAVARDEPGAGGRDARRHWWQDKKDIFEPDWDTRKLFTRPASALAIIWRFRDSDAGYNNRFKFTLVRVRRRAARASGVEAEPVQPVEERVP